MRAVCRYVSLAEVANLRRVAEYQTMVRPLEYDFVLDLNLAYLVVGIETREGTPWLYVARPEGDSEVRIVPAVLFEFQWSEVPPHWRLRLSERGEVELLPASFAAIQHWFEKYLDDDAVTVRAVHEEVERAREIDER